MISKKHQLQNEAIKMANEIFSDGRIEDSKDWYEMEVAMSFEMDEQKIPEEDRREMLATVKEKWY